MALTEPSGSAVQEVVDRYAPGAPESIRRLAAQRMVAYLGEAGRGAGSIVMLGNDGQQASYSSWTASALRASGAAELLSSWRRPRARVIGASS